MNELNSSVHILFHTVASWRGRLEISLSQPPRWGKSLDADEAKGGASWWQAWQEVVDHKVNTAQCSLPLWYELLYISQVKLCTLYNLHLNQEEQEKRAANLYHSSMIFGRSLKINKITFLSNWTLKCASLVLICSRYGYHSPKYKHTCNIHRLWAQVDCSINQHAKYSCVLYTWQHDVSIYTHYDTSCS